MQLDDYTRQVGEQLAAAAQLGDDRTQAIAAALATAAGPAIRLALLTGISAAADEVTAALLDTPGSPTVSARLDGEEVRIEVATQPTPADAETPPPVDDTDNSARVSLRLPETLKTSVEQAAAAEGISVNGWLVRAASSALVTNGGFRRGGPMGRPGGPGNNTQRVTGWING